MKTFIVNIKSEIAKIIFLSLILGISIGID